MSEDATLTTSHNLPGLLFFLVGPPGAGKNALINIILAEMDDIGQLATATTRPRRPTEQQGREHHFITPGEFQTMIADNNLLEWQQVHHNLYGIPRETVEAALARGHDLTADIDVLGATYIRSLYPENVVLIFIRPPSINELENRMRQRGEPETEIVQRMKRVAMEMAYAPVCDYEILNDDLERAAEKLRAIIHQERQRAAGQRNRFRFLHTVQVLAVHGGEILTRTTSPHFPQGLIERGEIPHLAALRVLQQQIQLDPAQISLYADPETPHHGSFTPPARLEVIPHADESREIMFMYIALLATRITPPDGWEWCRIEAVDLPVDIQALLSPHSTLSPND
jgi:guanylate kinase